MDEIERCANCNQYHQIDELNNNICIECENNQKEEYDEQIQTIF